MRPTAKLGPILVTTQSVRQLLFMNDSRACLHRHITRCTMARLQLLPSHHALPANGSICVMHHYVRP